MQAGDRDHAVSGNIRSEGDIFLNGAKGEPRNPLSVFKAETFYPHWTLEPAGDGLVKKICKSAGWQNCERPADTPVR